MTSKEALENLFGNYVSSKCYGINYKQDDENYNIIKQDLDRLEKLEKDFEKLKERYKHRAETSNDLCKAVKQYENVIEILVNKRVNIDMLTLSFEIDIGRESYNACVEKPFRLTQEEYELLKEVLGNVKDN